MELYIENLTIEELRSLLPSVYQLIIEKRIKELEEENGKQG